MSDISPTAPFRTICSGPPCDGGDPGGRVVEVIVDPHSPNILYAASEAAGIWKSTDSGRSWAQSGSGLKTRATTEFSGGSGHSLDIDTSNPQRLPYNTQIEDGRPGNPDSGPVGVYERGCDVVTSKPADSRRGRQQAQRRRGRPGWAVCHDDEVYVR